MAQLANIPARITLYELLRLSKETRAALQEALADSEAFITRVEQVPEQPEQCNLAAKNFPCISFTRDDMQVRNSKHDRPLYFSGNIGSIAVNRIQVDPGSAVSIMPLRLMYHLGIPASKLASTGTVIYGFNTSGSRPLGKVRVKCQLGDLKSEVTCYVIDAETSYNLLLGRPWIHGNLIVPSTLHQCLKYVDTDNVVKTVVADKQPFKGLENYFTDSLLYGAESDTEPSAHGSDSGNEADTEAGLDYDVNFEPFVIDLDETQSSGGGSCNWQLAEEYIINGDLEYVPCVDDIMQGLHNNYGVHVPLSSSNQVKKCLQSSTEATFVVSAKDTHQTIFGKKGTSPLQNLFWEADYSKAGDSDEGTCKNWFKYSPQARQYMKKWGYDFVHGVGLSFGRGIRAPVRPSYVPKGKPDRYYEHKRGLGYVTSSADECCWQIDDYDSSSESSAWDSDVSLGEVFKGLMVNMTTVGPIEPEEDDLLPDWEDPWTFHLSNQYGDRFEQREPPTKDEVMQVNMGDEAHPKPIFISNSLSPEEKEELIALIREYIDVFAWSYEDMPGLDPNVATHRLNIKIDAKPIKQQQRRFRPQIMEAIVAEVKRLIKSGFIKEIQHPDWVSNIVPVLKKNGTIRVCVDYRDLNAACPKDDFPLPITDVIIDNTCGFERMSFMDGFSGYNQIKMHPDDEKHTAFRTPIGIFCYTVMPFGLKNAGATYQRAMTTIFQEHIQKTVECYVDDLVVKSRGKNDHINDLRTVFDLMRNHQLKMNPTKSFLGMASGKFLGFVVTSKGIHIDPDKVKAINELQPPKNLKELRGLQGRLAYVRRFISNLAGKCQPFSKLAKKGVSFIWDDACQKAFEDIKTYLSNPPVLAAPKSGKPFLIYVRATNHSLSALLAQDDDNGHEQAVYYLSRTMVGAESRYPDIEKECLALVFAVQKMRHYLVGQTIHVISDVNPIRVFMTQPASLNWRLARWALLLSQYDIHFKQQKSVKGQAICDLLASQPNRDKVKIYDDLPDETYEVNHTSQEGVWQLYFDGASRATNVASEPGCSKISSGVGVILVSPGKHVMPRAYSLTEPCSNNVAEYNALLIGLSFAKELGVEYLEAFGDSQLIVNQVRGEYEARNPDLIPYYEAAVKMAESFESFFIEYIPRLQNAYADALAALAVSLAQPPDTEQSITVRTHQLFVPEYALDIKETHATNLQPRDWRFPLIDYVLYGILPEDIKERESVRRRAPRFYYNSTTQMLYRRTYDGLLLRCLSTEEAEEALKEAHDGTCGAHQPGPKLGDRLRRLGYYWPTMIKDAIAYARRCHACQIHANYMHQPPEDLHPSATSWPFETWGMDVVGPIFPPSAKGDRFILAITDYFSKWAEAIPLKEVKTSDVIKFIKHHIIYRYGVPRRIVHDNGPQFISNAFVRFCGKFRIQDISSTAYNPTANGLAEAFNKTIIKILSKLVKTNKRDWDDKLGEALWAYRTTVRTPTGVTPYSLVYGCEAVLPLEIQIPSLRIALATGMTDDEQHQKRLEELEALDGKRLEAQQQIELYQARISKAFNKKVRHRVFKEGDLVLAVRRPMILNSKKKGKFQSKWEGPFVIDTVYSNGAYRLITQDGDRLMMPINGKFLKKYYP